MDQPMRLKHKYFIPDKEKMFSFGSTLRSDLGLTLPSIYLRPLPGDITGLCVKLDIYLVLSLTLRLLMSYIYMKHLFLMFLDHTQRRSTIGRTPLDEWSARRRDLYLTTHDTHNRQICMPPVGFEPTISVSDIYDISNLRVNGLTLILLT
jgi:hypothetical protein